ncbi:MAG: hypothetical protein C4326_14740 [Ignavibacteria bacterium]
MVGGEEGAFVQALRYREQLRQSTIAEARSGADELVESAKRRLQYWDISEEEIRALEKRGTPKTLGRSIGTFGCKTANCSMKVQLALHYIPHTPTRPSRGKVPLR